MAVSHGTSNGVNSPQQMNTRAKKGSTFVSARKRSRSWRSARESLLARAAVKNVLREAKRGWKGRSGRALAIL